MPDQNVEHLTAIATLLTKPPTDLPQRSLSFVPQAGFGDTAAGQVHVILFTQALEDLHRATQIIEKGMAADCASYGLVDHFVRANQGPDEPQITA